LFGGEKRYIVKGCISLSLSVILEKLIPAEWNVPRSALSGMEKHWALINACPLNLSAIKDVYTAAEKHYWDSLMLLPFINEGMTAADIGSGGGFPGIPLALCREKTRFTLIDSMAKRCDFLNYCAEELCLNNTLIINSRAEKLARGEKRESFDLAFARALSSLPALLEYSLPLLKTGGILLAMKGDKSKTEEEALLCRNALSILGGEYLGSEKYVLPFSALRRSLAVFKKVSPCPEKYPRREGMAEKRPL
jgi:16S rRNA (guanine527-N7)-methyltransferase